MDTNSLAVFDFNSNQVRAILIDGHPWFIGNDVCNILGLSNTSKALGTLDEEDKNTITLSNGTPGNPNTTVINESGLYHLIFKSRKPEAKQFKQWVTSEVLPQIRKTGSYSIPKAKPTPQLGNQELLDYVDKVMETSTNFANHQPRLAQELTDVLMNRLKGEQKQIPSDEPRYRGAVEIAEEMGYSQAADSSIRTKLGRFLQTQQIASLAKKENRLCNGTSRPINCYPDTTEVRNAIALFFEH